MQAVVLVVNKRGGKDEVHRQLCWSELEVRDMLLYSRVWGLTMENVMGQALTVYTKCFTELILAANVFHHLITDFNMQHFPVALPLSETTDILQMSDICTSSLLEAGGECKHLIVSLSFTLSICCRCKWRMFMHQRTEQQRWQDGKWITPRECCHFTLLWYHCV